MKSVASYCLSSSSSFYVLVPCLHGLDGFHTRDSSTRLVSRVCIEADVLWPDALPDANPTLITIKCLPAYHDILLANYFKFKLSIKATKSGYCHVLDRHENSYYFMH